MNPLNALFGAGVALKNKLYDTSTLQQRRLQHSVVSVGNLSVGGAGKTPFVLLLGEVLKENKIAFDILSRGYGRQDHTIRLVDIKGKATVYGDEPLLLARALEVPVIVGADRFSAGQYAESLFRDLRPAHGSWLHVLDDGFQHRRLARDFDIVLISRSDLDDRLLPGGRLREPLASLERADAIVITDDTPKEALPAFIHSKQLWRVERVTSLRTPSPIDAVVFCGIAKPERFFADLQRLGIKADHNRVFPDHHRYNELDVENLLALRKRACAQAFITTAKDILNLEAAGLLNALQPITELSLRMRFVSPSPAEVLQAINQKVTATRNSLAPNG